MNYPFETFDVNSSRLWIFGLPLKTLYITTSDKLEIGYESVKNVYLKTFDKDKHGL